MLALDVGAKRVGVALSDPGRTIASPHSTLTNRGVRRLTAQVIELCRREAVQVVVVGLPLDASGDEGPATRLPRRVADELEAAGLEAARLEVVLWDERYSSREAGELRRGLVSDRRARARGIDDRVAAALILQGYLDSAGDGATRAGRSPADADDQKRIDKG